MISKTQVYRITGRTPKKVWTRWPTVKSLGHCRYSLAGGQLNRGKHLLASPVDSSTRAVTGEYRYNFLWNPSRNSRHVKSVMGLISTGAVYLLMPLR